MAISTISTKSGKSNFKSLGLYIAASFAVGALVFAIGYFGTSIQNLLGKSQLTVESPYQTYEVYVQGKLVGTTPVSFDKLKSGENKIVLKGDYYEDQVDVDVEANSHVIIKKDLGVSKNFSSGQVFWLEKDKSGTVASIISEPQNAKVFIDGTEVGKTPFTSNSLTDGGYELTVQADGYEPQTARIEIKKGFTVKGTLKLFPKPVSDKVSLFDGSLVLYNGLLDNTSVTSNTRNWVMAIAYWNKTRGIALGEAGVKKDSSFNFFLDAGGNFYDKDGNEITTKEGMDNLKGEVKGLYVAQGQTTQGISESAKTALTLIGGSVNKQVTILTTPTGWLRVRDLPSLSGVEIARVNVGSKYDVLEEKDGWVKIKISDSSQGWVSADYTEPVKAESQPTPTPTPSPTVTVSPTPAASPSATPTATPTPTATQ